MSNSQAPAGDEPPEPDYGFQDSRRLTGPNRYFASSAVTLTPLGGAAADDVALETWATRVRSMAQQLGWPNPQPVIQRNSKGTLLLFRAPAEALLTATELSEWAWERAAARAGEQSFDLAQDLGSDPSEVFRARAAAERTAPMAELREAAANHGLPFVEDDREVSIGAGAGSRRWLRESLPKAPDVPWDALHDVPTALVTGSNGKTTTVRLLAAMAASAGLTPGYCCTEGVFVAGEAIATGDYSGPDGARRVLRNRDVQAAILETARGGILRRGLAVHHAHVAVVINIQADHFGEYGIENADDLAETKLAVARVVGADGRLVLNADDATLMAAADRQDGAAAVNRALFAADYGHPALQSLRAREGSVCGIRKGHLMLFSDGCETDVGEVTALPVTLNGAAPYNVANLSAAALAATAMRWPLPAIVHTLRHFGANPADNPGRLERWRHRAADVLIDYAHNPEALRLLLRAARALKPKRLSLLLGQAGNRDDHAILELARTAASFAPDLIAIKELPLMLRGRAPGEVSTLLHAALLAFGVPAERLFFEADEEGAARRLLDAAGPGDLVVLPIHTRAVRERLIAMLDRYT